MHNFLVLGGNAVRSHDILCITSVYALLPYALLAIFALLGLVLSSWHASELSNITNLTLWSLFISAFSGEKRPSQLTTCVIRCSESPGA